MGSLAEQVRHQDSAGTEGAGASRDEKRNAALALLLSKIDAAGGNLKITSGALAQEVQAPVATVRTWMLRWVAEGAIVTRPAGRQGVIVRRGSGRRGRPAGGAPARGGAATRYCVWCGAPSTIRGARFCTACGKQLP